MTIATPPARFYYSKWRHGGWYVDNVRYPSGACGCISNNYADRKWRIACDPRPFDEQPTFKTRDEAALAEFHLAAAETARLHAAAPALLRACEELLGWADNTGGWEAPVWARAAKAYKEATGRDRP